MKWFKEVSKILLIGQYSSCKYTSGKIYYFFYMNVNLTPANNTLNSKSLLAHPHCFNHGAITNSLSAFFKNILTRSQLVEDRSSLSVCMSGSITLFAHSNRRDWAENSAQIQLLRIHNFIRRQHRQKTSTAHWWKQTAHLAGYINYTGTTSIWKQACRSVRIKAVVLTNLVYIS